MKYLSFLFLIFTISCTSTSLYVNDPEVNDPEVEVNDPEVNDPESVSCETDEDCASGVCERNVCVAESV